MSPRTIATLYAGGRVAIGTALLLAPERAGRGWVGKLAERPGAQALTQALGIRDLGLGAGTLYALQTGERLAPWLVASAVSDVTDLVATVRARDDVPASALALIGVVATSAAGLGLWLKTQLD